MTVTLNETQETSSPAPKTLKPVHDEIIILRDEYKKHVDIKDKTIVPHENAVIKVAETQGLNEETLEKVRVFYENSAAALGLLVGGEAIPIYVEDKEVQSVQATFPTTGKDKLVVTSKRVVNSPNIKDRTQVHQSFGPVTVIMEQSLGNKNSGKFGVVYNHVRNAAAEALRDL